MTTNVKDYIIQDNEEFRNKISDTMEGQFEQNLNYKSFSNQLESDEIDTLQQKIEWWMTLVDRGGPIPNDVYDYSFAELINFYRKTIDPEMQEFVKALGDRPTNPLKKAEKLSVNKNLT